MKTYYSVASSCDDKGRVNAAVTSSVEADKCPESTFRAASRKDIYIDWFDSLEAAREFAAEAKNA